MKDDDQCGAWLYIPSPQINGWHLASLLGIAQAVGTGPDAKAGPRHLARQVGGGRANRNQTAWTAKPYVWIMRAREFPYAREDGPFRAGLVLVGIDVEGRP